MLHLILFIHVSFLYIPLSISPLPPTISLSLFHSLSFLKAKRLCRLLGHFPLCHRRSCCCYCPRGKYASISFTPCNVVGLTATPDCAPGLLFNYFVNVFFSLVPSSSFLFFSAAVVHFVRPQKASRIGQELRPFWWRFPIQVGAAFPPLICDSMCSVPDQLMSRCH